MVAENLSISALKRMFDGLTKISTDPRALVVLKGGKTVVRLGFALYTPDEPMYLYSLSKPFTSIAVGICCDLGLLSPYKRLSEIFPEKMPKDASEALMNMTLEDALTMRTGHGKCVIEEMRWGEDALEEFFKFPLQSEPGMGFVYSTGATCVCAAAVERVTGEKLVDFLDKNLFSKLGIKKPEWRECRDGTSLGGTGLLLSADDVAKFGQMLLNGGVYNGERIVSSEYIEHATKWHSNGYMAHESSDWSSGYGYQFWRNGRGGFRGDGAYGQICFVLPEEDVVLVFFGESVDAVAEFELVNRMLDELFVSSDGDVRELELLCENLYKPARGEPFVGEISRNIAENGLGLRAITLAGDNGRLKATLVTDGGTREIVCGNGEYIRTRTTLRGFDITQVPPDPKLAREMPFDVFGCYEKRTAGSVALTLRHADTCHTQEWLFDLSNGKWTVTPRRGTLCVKEFDLI